jgi:hypothetical protein
VLKIKTGQVILVGQIFWKLQGLERFLGNCLRALFHSSYGKQSVSLDMGGLKYGNLVALANCSACVGD